MRFCATFLRSINLTLLSVERNKWKTDAETNRTKTFVEGDAKGKYVIWRGAEREDKN
jgi:hypothetical protein